MPAYQNNKVIYVELPSGSKAEIALFGSTVTSWVVDNKERIFVSKEARRDGSKAIRGGIPICFPIFGTKEIIRLPQHGFARSSYWEYLGVITDNNKEVSVRLGLMDTQLSSEVRKVWPHSFRLVYTNEGEDTFEFNILLHTYFRVPDVSRVQIQGLISSEYIDKTAGSIQELEKNDKVTISQEVDRVYKKVQDHLLLEIGDGSCIIIEKSNLRDTVVWNPWIEKAQYINDLVNDEYKNMVCVEPGSVAEWVKLAGGQTWAGGQSLTIR
ncbi:hypothetical protein G6F46_001527 [Rhizopus delemar]|uniref:Glucose-6-phosphate 1-epimerase n=2 Tax=Rhizopus TaxID=4842 RepID=A0A9P7CNM7_9FUNG|nr:hypothetical protein G6F55_005851 [Rhizopus delemar]KAG1551860.1 hypothetical protein G6F51_001591 [Rhizopus arrhizus]KAG1496297.1 hypothetical protein G6F54_006571 [Rhizopus delemar]KAG1517616.1 hypothetical protein G6F53_001241 [Rhizopus delemar]KAG1524958.1 hypothetical protein G6F52_003751 [Rhizopus delemar]